MSGLITNTAAGTNRFAGADSSGRFPRRAGLAWSVTVGDGSATTGTLNGTNGSLGCQRHQAATLTVTNGLTNTALTGFPLDRSGCNKNQTSIAVGSGLQLFRWEHYRLWPEAGASRASVVHSGVHDQRLPGHWLRHSDSDASRSGSDDGQSTPAVFSNAVTAAGFTNQGLLSATFAGTDPTAR